MTLIHIAMRRDAAVPSVLSRKENNFKWFASKILRAIRVASASMLSDVSFIFTCVSLEQKKTCIRLFELLELVLAPLRSACFCCDFRKKLSHGR